MAMTTEYGIIAPSGATGIQAAANELNGLPNNGIAICSSEVWSNVQGDGQGNGYLEPIVARLTLAPPATVYSANAAIYAWILSAYDGVKYPEILNAISSSSGSSATTSTTQPLPGIADFAWPLNVDSSVQAQTRDARCPRSAPLCAKNYLVVWNQSGVTLVTGLTDAITLYFESRQFG